MWVVVAPTKIPVSSKADFSLNMNEYRNAHHQVLAKAKVNFTKLMLERVKHLPKMQQVNLTYTHFSGSNTLSDTANICSIVDKFFSDTLVEAGCLQDDNYTVVKDVNFRHGGVDAGNARVEVTIEPIGEYEFPPVQEEEDMQITLVQTEIEQAITDFVTSQVHIKPGMKIVIDLSATRGAEGFKATIDIVADPDAPAVEVVAAEVLTVVKAADKPAARTITVAKAEVVKDTGPKAFAKAQTTGTASAVKASEPVQAEAASDTASTQVIPTAEEAEELAQALAEDSAAEDEEADAELVEEEVEAEVETPAPTKPATSLFAGLQRPKNS